ncbi:GntR family transcriptional regulator [Alteribacter natronophilus]|uniref:GntR family transcriptional regulator n=1 Tax=Alteribacter natronophilus TaxID=2583810 RepID=UPI00110F1A4D|nr:GntR family transcriptional regulator [Alteribacter natronophilus]TMW72735.1 GntR family transcriptional regulator [Alteribacter natronophilus]
MVDKTSSIPLYVQVKNILLDDINNGVYHPGDKLPTEKELTSRFNISRMTLRQAMNALIEEGRLMRLKGIGTMVQDKKLEQPLTTLKSFTDDIRERGLKPSTRVLSFTKQKGSIEAVRKLGIPKSKDIWVTKRIRYADNAPFSIEKNIVSVHHLPNLTKEIMTNSLHSHIKSEGYQMVKAKTTIEAALPTEDERKLLDITDNSPVLIVERLTYLENGEIIEWSVSKNRSDRYRFTAELIGQP